MNASDIVYLLPELILLLTGFVALGVDLARGRNDEGRASAITALIGLALALAAALYLVGLGANQVVVTTMAVDPFALFFKAVTTVGIGLVILASMNYMKGRSKYLGEFYALLTFAALAISVTVSATNLILVYLGVEFLSITSYILAGFIRGDKLSEEAAIKYFLYGASAGAVMLYGISLLYGATGSTDLTAVGQALSASGANLYLGVTAIIFLSVGFGFKATWVPFHHWAPDTYDGAPTPVTAYLSTASKAAGFAVAARVFITAMPTFAADWTNLLAALAILTMSVANFVALKQSSVKRMLAYSSVAHAGYILIGLAAIGADPTFNGLNGLLIYILAYIFTNVGAFLVVMAVERRAHSNDLAAYAGLVRRAPGLTLLMTIFLLSLAGIPPTAGFIGKFFVLGAAVRQDMLILAAVGAVNVVIAAAYYLNVVRYMFFVDAESAGPQIPLGGRGLASSLIICAIMVFVIGIFAQPFITWAGQSVNLVIAGGF